MPLWVRARDGGTIASRDNVLLDWWVGQDGKSPVAAPFFVDIYLDGTPVNRWNADAFALRSFLFTEDWPGLLEKFNLSPGQHTVRLFIDPTDLINESNEDDNVFEAVLRWDGPPPPVTTAKKLPNFIPGAPVGRDEPLVVSGHSEAPRSGQVSVDAPIYVALGLKNAGVASARDPVHMDLYMDGTLVERFSWDGVVAGTIGVASFDRLRTTVPVAPGRHTLTVVADPTDLVRESNEDDNVYSVTVEWATGPTPPMPQATAVTSAAVVVPPRKTMPDLEAAIPHGWDAAITARADNAPENLGRDGPLSASAGSYVSFAFWNASPVGTGASHTAAVFIDGKELDTQKFAGNQSDSAAVWQATIAVLAGSLQPGPHTVRVVFDSPGTLAEADEQDNAVERVFTWSNGPLPPPPGLLVYSDAQLEAMLAAATGEMMLEAGKMGGPDGVAKDWTQAVLDAGDAGYALVTGRSTKDERLVVHLVSRQEFEAARLSACLKLGDTLTEAQYMAKHAECSAPAQELGFKTRLEGKVHIFIDVEHSPAQVLATYFHELGHALQDFLDPALTEASDNPPPGLDALQEAQAQAFEAAAWRRIEEFMGVVLLQYPSFGAMQQSSEKLLLGIVDEASTGEEHSLGYVYLWATVMLDLPKAALRSEIEARHTLSVPASKALFDYLVAIKPEGVTLWTQAVSGAAQQAITWFRGIVKARLLDGLPQDSEGHPDLVEAALAAP